MWDDISPHLFSTIPPPIARAHLHQSTPRRIISASRFLVPSPSHHRPAPAHSLAPRRSRPLHAACHAYPPSWFCMQHIKPRPPPARPPPARLQPAARNPRPHPARAPPLGAYPLGHAASLLHRSPARAHKALPTARPSPAARPPPTRPPPAARTPRPHPARAPPLGAYPLGHAASLLHRSPARPLPTAQQRGHPPPILPPPVLLPPARCCPGVPGNTACISFKYLWVARETYTLP
ncbi:hypothetical protein B0H11DRAFT_2234360 [Mycena galericulata]|nr:hypothetical protein B0H11DRAFT_2234360 [Mycena galericulata]